MFPAELVTVNGQYGGSLGNFKAFDSSVRLSLFSSIRPAANAVAG